MKTRRPRTFCPRCNKNVAIHTTARTAGIGSPVKHNCPHGEECMESGTLTGGFEPYCLECRKVFDPKHAPVSKG